MRKFCVKFHCDKCDDIYLEINDLEKHIITCHPRLNNRPERPNKSYKMYYCDNCRYKTDHRVDLIMHKKRALNMTSKKAMCDPNKSWDKIFKCGDCGKGFTSEKKVLRHAKVHTIGKPHECHICGLKFTEKWNLNNHIKKVICNKIMTTNYKAIET